MRPATNFRHGHALKPGHVSRTYSSWQCMKMRCLNPRIKQWSDYGGRGIKMCKRWLDFKNFLADMGVRPEGKTLDRIDNDGNYEPGNCRWATKAEQIANTARVLSDRCRRGHRYTPETMRIENGKHRRCTVCKRITRKPRTA